MKNYITLWLLLAVAFVTFAVASATGLPEIFGHKLKTADIAQSLLPEKQLDDEIIDSIAEVQLPENSFPMPVDTAKQTILFIGDSMLEGLGPRLAAYAKHNGHTLYNVIWYSSTSEVWGCSDKLRRYMATLKPTYVFICLGANELFVSNIKDKRRQYVEKIVADIDTLPYLWIGPPNWKPDTGINDLVAESTPQGCFFLSDGMSFDRTKDGAHPTRTSAAAWMDSVIRWMPAHSLHPIRMDVPEQAADRPTRVFVHQPGER